MNAAISMHATITLFATIFPDWNSLDSVRRAHSDLEGAALVFFALLVASEALAHLSDDKKTERRLDRIGIVFFAIAVLAEIAAYPYGQRNDTLSEQIIVSLDAKSREAFSNASSALTKSSIAETKADGAAMKADVAEDVAGKAKTEASSSLTITRSARREVGELRSDIEKAEEEAFESQMDLRRSMYQSFQRTGNRTVDPFMFLHVLKGKPTGNVVLWVKVDGGEPHQYAWQIWHTLNRSPGWSAQIKRWEDKPPSIPPVAETGLHIRCRTLPDSSDWLRNPKTACEALVDAVMQGTDGPPSLGAPMDSDTTLGDNEFAIEISTQPKPLAAPATPNKQ